MADNPKKIGWWLGIAHCIGSDMTCWILTQSGKVIARSTVQHVIHSEMQTAINMRLDEANSVNDADNVYYLDDDLNSTMNTVDETQMLQGFNNFLVYVRPRLKDGKFFVRSSKLIRSIFQPRDASHRHRHATHIRNS